MIRLARRTPPILAVLSLVAAFFTAHPAAAGSSATSQTGAPGLPSVQQAGQVPASPVGPQETARLATAVGFIDVAGLKLGAPLASVQPLLKGINPKFAFEPQVEIIWPGSRPPPNAPRSLKFLRATAVQGNSSEEFYLEFAQAPNPAVVIKINRQNNFELGKGPSFDNIVAGLRKKYGPESAINTTTPPGTFVARWFFDERGQALRGNLANQIFDSCRGADTQPTNQGLCSTLTVLNANVQADGSGVVISMIVNATNEPLKFNAQETTNALLSKVQQDVARQQQNEASQRAAPKL